MNSTNRKETMEKYFIKPVKPKKYRIIEQETMYVIAEFTQKTRAAKMIDHLNSGAAFDGQTPGFFVGWRVHDGM